MMGKAHMSSIHSQELPFSNAWGSRHERWEPSLYVFVANGDLLKKPLGIRLGYTSKQHLPPIRGRQSEGGIKN